MWKNRFRIKVMPALQTGIILITCCLCSILAGGSYAGALAEKPQYAKEEYEAQYDNAVGLAELLRTSPDMLHNKLYTAEQEAELQALVDSVCGSAETDRKKVQNLLACIFQNLEPGSCYGLNSWDTLCDGETDMVDTAGKTVGKKREVNDEVYCFTFYDVCRLAGIPCFILEDDFTEASNNRYIAMVYIESAAGTGKEWHFVDVANEKMLLSSRDYVYEELGTEFYPKSLVLDYDTMRIFRSSIYLKKEREIDGKDAPLLAYDHAADTVKAWFPLSGVLAAGEQYHMTEQHIGEDGEAPSGWIESKEYSSGTVTTCRSYAVCGVFLRGRVTINGQEYELTHDGFLSFLPYYDHQTVKSEPESQEHKDAVLEYKKELENKAVSYADAMLADKSYIWDDTYFEDEEDEKLLQEAVNTALDWDYITSNAASETAFQTAGIPFKPLAEQEPGEMTDKAKAQALLLYIKKNIKTVDHGVNFVTSATVLKQKEGTCEGHSRLYRDMCVMAGIPCFQLRSSYGMKMGDVLYGDHGHNMVRAGDQWLFCDPMNAGVIGKNNCYPLGFYEGYDTANSTEIRIDRGAVKKDHYGKWMAVGGLVLNYFDFDSEGKLGIYQRSWSGEPVAGSETDENGRYTVENGLHIVDVPEMNEDRSAEIVTRYVYYRQNLRTLQGKKMIDGTEYDFNTYVGKVVAKCHKLKEVSRRYVISRLTFQPLADQPYKEGGVCPVPEIYHGDKKLEYGKDFIITEYKYNNEITTYTDARYKVEGIGDYTGEATRYFKVVQADISEQEITLSQTSFEWRPDQWSYKPQVESDLSPQNYSVTYYDYDKIGRARVVITGRKNCKGSLTIEYDICPGKWNADEFIITDKNDKPLQSQKFIYSSVPAAVQARVCWRDETGRMRMLSEDSDYDISYTGTERPGTVTVTATAKGKYQGTLTCTYEMIDDGENEKTDPGDSGVGDGTGNNGSATDSTGNNGSETGGSGNSQGGSSQGGSSSGAGSTGNGVSGGSSGIGSTGNGVSGGSGTGTAKGDKTAGETKNVSTGSAVVKKLKLTAKKKTIKVSWQKVKKAKGYKLQISKYKNYKKAKTKTVKKSKKSYTFKKLQRKKKYYIRIRVYQGTVGKGKKKKKVYGKWTGKSIRVP